METNPTPQKKVNTRPKPYWKNDFYNRKYYKLTDAKKFADDIEQATGVRPIFTYHRMLGAMWVRTKTNV